MVILHYLLHYTRYCTSREYRINAALARLESLIELEREIWANESALILRSLGHPCPVGSTLAGIRVTR